MPGSHHTLHNRQDRTPPQLPQLPQLREGVGERPQKKLPGSSEVPVLLRPLGGAVPTNSQSEWPVHLGGEGGVTSGGG